MQVLSKDDQWRQFLALCSKIKSPERLDEFFDLFLTIEERKAVADRYEIIRQLLLGEKTQREIAAQHKVSIATITRGSNYLKTISGELRKFLEREI